MADLKGKKVAVAKGSSANAFLAYALEGAGLAWGDVEATFLLPADAKAAFDGGSVDAWAIWDPYAAVAEETSNARSIADGTTANHTNRSFYLASRAFATDHAEALAGHPLRAGNLRRLGAANPGRGRATGCRRDRHR